MSDPQTTNLGFYIPTRGSDVGTWDLPVNANSSALDSIFSNVATLSLTNSNVTLNQPPNSGAAWSGPYQSQSALLNMTGNITANITITLPRPGYFLFANNCISGASGTTPAGGIDTAFSIAIASAAPGKIIGAPPGSPFWVFNDGVNVSYVDPEPTGFVETWSIIDTALPSWVTVCTLLPYLLCDGSSYAKAAFPNLFGIIGNLYGGGGSNFHVPNLTSSEPFGTIIVIKT
jgi:hypothetical protein